MSKENEEHLISLYNAKHPVILGCFEAYQKNSSLSSLLETLVLCCQLIAEEGDNTENSVEEKNESEQEEDAPEHSGADNGGDYEKVKEHMHMVLARYAKEGIIDYKEAAQVHDVCGV